MPAQLPASGDAHRLHSFGEFTLDLDRGALFRAGNEVRLRPKSFEVLRYLVEHHGRLATKDELLGAIWGDTVVTEDSLTQCLIEVRKALGDGGRRMIRTVPRRGYIFELPVEESGGAPAATQLPSHADKGPGRLRWLSGAALVLALGAAAVWWGSDETPKPVVHEPGITANSIAVLPFVDMSPEQDHEYFGDGISEEILNLLAQSTALKVIARTSTFAFKNSNPDIATIAEQLGVAHVLEGSVRRSGDRVRVTAQLVDASTSVHLWSETYDRDLGDILEVQADIAASVAEALKVTLADDEASIETRPVDPQAYTHFLQGNFFYSRRAPGDLERARDYFRRALDIEPEFARAWAGLAGAYFVLTAHGHLDLEAGPALQSAAVERALALNPDLAEAHIRAAQYHKWFGDRGRVVEHVRRARSLNPDSPLVLAFSAGDALWRGRPEEAVAWQQQAVALDPLGAVNRYNLASYLLAAGQFAEAKAESVRAKALNPAVAPEIDIRLAFILIVERQFDEALAAIRQWPEGLDRDQALALVLPALGRDAEGKLAFESLVAAEGADAAIRVAEVHAWRGEVDQSFRWLETFRDKVPRDTVSLMSANWVDTIVLSPFLRPLRNDPRWEALFDEIRDLLGPADLRSIDPA